MLFRGQNILGYKNYADDVVEYFVQKSIANGIDIIRIFDALNDVRNLKCAIDACQKEKGHVQATVCYTIDVYKRQALGSAEVTAEAALSPEMLLNAVSAVGYKASFATAEDLSIEETHQFSKAEIIIGLIFGFLVMYIGMSHMLPFPLPLPGIISMEAVSYTHLSCRRFILQQEVFLFNYPFV